MELHKLAKYFPILEGEEFDLLVKDIKEHGQIEPIIMINDEILDGVNRWMACEQLGIQPIIEQFKGDDPLSYVISLNVRRRHLDVSQRSMLATEMLPEFEKKAKKRQGQRTDLTSESIGQEVQKKDHLARDDAAKQFGVSGVSVQRAKRIKEEAPDKVDDIIKGKITVGAADNELRQNKAKQTAQERKEKEIKKEILERKEYKAYLEATKQFKHELELAIQYTKQNLFAPESRGWIEKRHEELFELMSQLEDLL